MEISAARINAQDIEFIQPLREYFESHGCVVDLNTQHKGKYLYYIAVGDYSFVKNIFSENNSGQHKRLGIIYDSSNFNAENLTNSLTKIIVIDPEYLSQKNIKELFSFFITGNSQFADKRRNRHDPKTAPLHQAKTNIPIQESVRKIKVYESESHQEATIKDEERIESILSDIYQNPVSLKKHTNKPKHRHTRNTPRKGFITIIFWCAFLIIIPVIWYCVSLGISGIATISGIKDLERGDSSGARHYNTVASHWLYQATFTFECIKIPFHLAGLDTAVRGQERLLSLLSDSNSAIRESTDLLESGKKTIKMIMSHSPSSTGESIAASLEELHVLLTTVSQSLALSQAELSMLTRDRTFPFSIKQVETYGTQKVARISVIRQQLSYADELLAIYPTAAGFVSPRTYLLLFQNSAELRPTGGFIGSIASVTLENGIISDFDVKDVYEIDGQLKGHVDPPTPIRDLYKQEHWYLRDSNWDPDFSISAARAAWFYQKEMGKDVDGVIAINLPAVVDMLAALGPVNLPDYNDRITAENFFGKSFYYSQNNYFPGSTQKGDFLGSLTRTLINKITEDQNLNYAGIIQALIKGLNGHDILFWFADESNQFQIKHFGWGGTISSENECLQDSTGSCFPFPLFVAEANMSVSKVNYFIKHTSQEELTISNDGKIHDVFSWNIQNTYKKSINEERGLGGPYTTYIRIYMPQTARINEITVNSISPAYKKENTVTTSALPYMEPAPGTINLRAIGIAFKVPEEETVTLRVSLGLDEPLTFHENTATLNILRYKHPGISNEQNIFKIRYPPGWSAKNETIAGVETRVENSGHLLYNTTITQNRHIRIRFTQ
jgi:hypothetical protein